LRVRNTVNGKRQDPLGAKLHGYELHDDMQRAGRDLPNCLPASFGSGLAVFEWSGNVEHPRPERDGEYGLFVGLHHEPAQLPNKLRPVFSIPMMD
jgi:hypothetical protein